MVRKIVDIAIAAVVVWFIVVNVIYTFENPDMTRTRLLINRWWEFVIVAVGSSYLANRIVKKYS